MENETQISEEAQAIVIGTLRVVADILSQKNIIERKKFVALLTNECSYKKIFTKAMGYRALWLTYLKKQEDQNG